MKATLKRVLKKKCPACGRGILFCAWNELAESCRECGYIYEEEAGDSWGFVYLSTAFMTGLILLPMFLLAPSNLLIARVLLFVLALVVIIGTLPLRKAIAVGFNYEIRMRNF